MKRAVAIIAAGAGRRLFAASLFALIAISLQGCGSNPTPAANTSPDTASPPFKPVASIRELMDSTVDPAADGLWDAVSTTVTYAGIEKREPRTDEEWRVVRRHAITLAEAMNLVIMDGRHAAPPGTKAGLGELTPAQIDAKIAANRTEFYSFAGGVRDNALQALQAIDRKDAKTLFKIGGDIDATCEGCHVTFWYPNSPRPAN